VTELFSAAYTHTVTPTPWRLRLIHDPWWRTIIDNTSIA